MAWQMPGMDSPCMVDTGESSAPVGQKRTRFHRPDWRPGRTMVVSTAALHPHPEPPQWTSWASRSKRSRPQSL